MGKLRSTRSSRAGSGGLPSQAQNDDDPPSGRIWLFTDGGSSPNPGPAGIAFLVVDEHGVELQEGSQYIGEATNNVAEYFALIRGLAACSRYPERSITWVCDSELVVRQMEGTYAVREDKLKPLHAVAVDIAKDLKQFRSEHRGRKDPTLARVDAHVRRVRQLHDTGA